MGSQLGPALAEAYLQARGLAGVQRQAGSRPEEIWVSGSREGSPKPERIELSARGSSTAFTALANHECELGMSSRPISAAEAAELQGKGLGDLQSAAAEHVIGLDGVAVIVHPNNPLRSLDFEQLRRIFSGRSCEFPGDAAALGSVRLQARDNQPGTFQTSAVRHAAWP